MPAVATDFDLRDTPDDKLPTIPKTSERPSPSCVALSEAGGKCAHAGPAKIARDSDGDTAPGDRP
jgi:hypothetical protein